MAHCPYAKLADLKDSLREIRLLDRVSEKKPGIFYIGSKGFLHFHIKDGKRWADVRDGADWGEPIDVPAKVSSRFQIQLVKEVRRRHARTIGRALSS
jgi:hypothetical protein